MITVRLLINHAERVLLQERWRHRLHHDTPLHVLRHRQTEEITQSGRDIRWVGRGRSATDLDTVSQQHEEAIGAAFGGGVPRLPSAQQAFDALEGTRR